MEKTVHLMQRDTGTQNKSEGKHISIVGIIYSPTWRYPRASTLEKAVVGVGGAAIPMKLLVLPCERKVETRGVIRGKGTPPARFESVIVEGVRDVGSVGEGGKTNNV